MCEFCNIANKKQSAYIVYESENTVAFLDMDPINEGHRHFHVFPRYQNDGFGWTASEEKFEYSQNVADKLRSALEIN